MIIVVFSPGRNDERLLNAQTFSFPTKCGGMYAVIPDSHIVLNETKCWTGELNMTAFSFWDETQSICFPQERSRHTILVGFKGVRRFSSFAILI